MELNALYPYLIIRCQKLVVLPSYFSFPKDQVKNSIQVVQVIYIFKNRIMNEKNEV